ncbi:uncharacterized protein OCT59_020567 [Rhizophagus irregularis]|uniref:uncharacterized protein n=1 Tax=Rhizophagus irregularis TaxID=588596 RepID=UPI0033224204|nr:hypothetical protein OCT59_020567 [Rhizophagus irregularis]
MLSSNQNNNSINRRRRRLQFNRIQLNRRIRLLLVPSSINILNNNNTLRRMRELPPQQNIDDEFAEQLFNGTTFF